MIRGIGTDIVLVERFIPWLEKPVLLHRFFHAAELKDIQKKAPLLFAASLAVRFAAKEAFGKALGTGLHGLTLKNIYVHTTHSGKPSIHLEGDAQKAFIRSGAHHIHVTLSHEATVAVAFVILE